MGRRGSEVRQRTVVRPVRLTPDEDALIQERAKDSGVPVSEFFRSAALGRKTRSTLDSQIINELRLMGSKLNSMGGMLKDQFNKSGGQYAEESAAVLREIQLAIARISKLKGG